MPSNSMAKDFLVWIDCEMTGLDVFNDRIIEICCILTDGNLNVLDEKGYHSYIHCPKDILDNMNEWCINQHGKSGLTQKVLNCNKTVSQVENELLNYIKRYIPTPNTALLSGNSVHMDKFFMMKEMPKVINHLHYRILDVSSFSEMCKRHNYDLFKKQPKKLKQHTAKSHILESMEQMKWFLQNYCKEGPNN